MWALKTLRKIVTSDLGSGLNIRALLSASYSSSSTPAPSRPISPVPQSSSVPSVPTSAPQSLAPPAPPSLRGSTESLESSGSFVKPSVEVKTVPEMPLVSLLKGLPEALLRQAEYEDPLVRGGKHLMHSQFFKVSTITDSYGTLWNFTCHLITDSTVEESFVPSELIIYPIGTNVYLMLLQYAYH